ncbi:MAG: radical SAM protein [Anaerolineae bacterium]|nr:radical SAM protein [Anaerolineae bacterium]
MSSLHYLKYAKRIFYKRGASPLYFVYFVTERCNARCKHCLLGQKRADPTGELTIDEIAKVSASMGDMLFFTPTGGEPFLRRDLSEIVHIFHVNNHALNVGIPTNGSMPGRVLNSVKTMLEENPDLDLHIDVSIDGLPELHDEIRQVPGLFHRAIETYKALRELEHFYPKFSTCIQVTVSAFNQHQLLDLYDYLKRKVGVNTVFTLLTRGEPRDPAAKNFDISKYEEFHRVLEEDNKRLILSGYYKMPFSDVLNAKRIVRPRIIAKTVRENRYQIPCYAGTLGGAMFSKGQVLPCELRWRDVIGNVRDVDYDFMKLWLSPKADEIRQDIRKNKCFCTYECFLTINILFNPLVLPRVGWEWAQLKWAKLRYRLAGGRITQAPPVEEASPENK